MKILGVFFSLFSRFSIAAVTVMLASISNPERCDELI